MRACRWPSHHRLSARPAVAPRLVACALAGLTLATLGITAASAAPGLAEALTPVPPAPPQLPAALSSGQPPDSARDARGFEINGFLERAAVRPCSDGASDFRTPGGFAWVNGMRYTIPCNTMVLLPGTTASWGDLFGTETERPSANLALDGDPHPPAQSDFVYPATEIRISGNIVNGNPIAGRVSVTQHAAMRGEGFITSIDYKAGRLGVGSIPGGRDDVVLEINDPLITDTNDPAFGKGRYSAGQSSDARFTADPANPTIRSITGYPMCIPRLDPDVADDTFCPQRNRPANGASSCRSLTQAGIAQPAATRLTAAATATRSPWCTLYVMKYPPGTQLTDRGTFTRPDGITVTNPEIAGPAEPDARHMAPFKLGDFISYAGNIMVSASRSPSPPAASPSPEVVSVHSIEANVAIYTAPGSLPAYAAITEVEIGADPPAAPVVNSGSVAQQTGGSISLKALVTDPTAIADLYFVDLEPGKNIAGFPRPGHVPGDETHRWLTPNAITGEIGAIGSSGLVIGGGIAARLRTGKTARVELQAARVNPGVIVSPTRYARLVLRSLCDPANINGRAAVVPSNGTNTACLRRARTANGLYSGQYLAPAELLFPDNSGPGEPRSAKDFWSLGFLVNGEGGTGRSGETLAPGGLSPTPW